MTTSLVNRLRSALCSLQAAYPDDPETLHFAVAAVFSSIFLQHSIRAVIVGGQAATHWLRVAGSRDADFVVSDYHGVKDALEAVGFAPTDAPYRLLHPGTSPKSSVLIELVGESIEIAGLRPRQDAVTTIAAADIESPLVRDLMGTKALVVEPALVFLNYAEAGDPESVWYDHADEGSLASDRATALLALYHGHIVKRVRRLADQMGLSPRLVEQLRTMYGVELPSAERGSGTG